MSDSSLRPKRLRKPNVQLSNDFLTSTPSSASKRRSRTLNVSFDEMREESEEIDVRSKSGKCSKTPSTRKHDRALNASVASTGQLDEEDKQSPIILPVTTRGKHSSNPTTKKSRRGFSSSLNSDQDDHKETTFQQTSTQKQSRGRVSKKLSEKSAKEAEHTAVIDSDASRLPTSESMDSASLIDSAAEFKSEIRSVKKKNSSHQTSLTLSQSVVEEFIDSAGSTSAGKNTNASTAKRVRRSTAALMSDYVCEASNTVEKPNQLSSDVSDDFEQQSASKRKKTKSASELRQKRTKASLCKEQSSRCSSQHGNESLDGTGTVNQFESSSSVNASLKSGLKKRKQSVVAGVKQQVKARTVSMNSVTNSDTDEYEQTVNVAPSPRGQKPQKRSQMKGKKSNQNISYLEKETDTDEYEQTVNVTPSPRGQKPQKRSQMKGKKPDQNISYLEKETAPEEKEMDSVHFEVPVGCKHCGETYTNWKEFKSHVADAHHRILKNNEDFEGEFDPDEVHQLLGSISCLQCKRKFRYFNVFLKHSKLQCSSTEEMRTYLGISTEEQKEHTTVDGRARRQAAVRARELLHDIVLEVDDRNKTPVSYPPYTVDGHFPEAFIRACDDELNKSHQLTCCYEDCDVKFTEVKLFVSHLSDCSMRTKFLDKGLETTSDCVCLHCGRVFPTEDKVKPHAEKHLVSSSRQESRTANDSSSESAENLQDDEESESESESEPEDLVDDESTTPGGGGAERVRSRQHFFQSQDELNDVAVKTYVKFIQRCATQSLVFPDWLPEMNRLLLIEPEDCIKYQPSNRDFDVCIQTSASDRTTLPKLSFGDSSLLKKSININVGGPVWSMSWCPADVGQFDHQYLAVYTNKTCDETHLVRSQSQSDVLLQIYDCGILKSNTPPEKPRLMCGFVVDCGSIWDMKWCPIGGRTDDHAESSLQRIGLLAIASQSGYIHILSVPRLTSEALYYRVTPNISLCQFSRSAGCVSIDWSLYNGCSFIIAGFTDGTVSLWDLNTTSPLLRSNKNDGRTVELLPYLTFSAHMLPVSGVALCQAVPFAVVTCSHDRMIKLWDVRQTAQGPIVFMHMPKESKEKDASFIKSSIFTRSLTANGWLNKVVWPPSSLAFYTCTDECYTFQINKCYQHQVVGTSFSREPICVHNASIWDVSFNSWLNLMVQCDSAGFVAISRVTPPKSRKTEVFKYAIMQTELTKASESSLGSDKNQPPSENVGESDCSQMEAEDRKRSNTASVVDKILVKDFSEKYRYRKPLASAQDCPSDDILSNYQALHQIAWNPNLGSHQWLAVGGQAGLIRIILVDHAELSSVPYTESLCRRYSKTKSL